MKTAGKIFVAFSVIVAIAAACFASYMGGQKKVIEKYYNAIVRSDYSAFDKCFADGTDFLSHTEKLSADFGNAAAEVIENKGAGVVHSRVNFVRRVMNSPSDCEYYYTVSYYNDDVQSFTSEEMKLHLVYGGMEWRLAEVFPEQGC